MRNFLALLLVGGGAYAAQALRRSNRHSHAAQLSFSGNLDDCLLLGLDVDANGSFTFADVFAFDACTGDFFSGTGSMETPMLVQDRTDSASLNFSFDLDSGGTATLDLQWTASGTPVRSKFQATAVPAVATGTIRLDGTVIDLSRMRSQNAWLLTKL